MRPMSPVVKGFEDFETVLAKDQPQYEPLPVIWCRDENGTVISKWKLTWRERFRIFLSGELYISQMTFHDHPDGCFQPQLPGVIPPPLEKKYYGRD